MATTTFGIKTSTTESFSTLNNLAMIIEPTMKIIEATCGWLYLVNPDTQQLTLEIALPSHNHDDDAELADQTLQNQQLYTKPVEAGWMMVYLPLTIYESLSLGVLGFKVPSDLYTPKDEMVLQMAANQAAMIITNSRLLVQHEAQESKISAEHTLLLKVYEAIPALEADQELEDYVEHVARTYHHLGWTAVKVALAPEFGLEPYLFNTKGAKLPDTSSDQWKKNTLATAQQWGNAVMVFDANGWDVLLIAITKPDGSQMAVVELYQAAGQKRLSEESTRPLMIFARHFGNAIERYKLIGSLRQAAAMLTEQLDELEFIRKADREISSKLDPDRITQFTLDWALRRTAADAGAIIAINSATHELTVKEAIGYREEEIRKLRDDSEGTSIIARAIREKTKQVVDDVSQDPDYALVLPETVTQLVIPLISNRRTIGIITLESSVKGRFDDNAVQFIERVASMTAIALDNAQLLRQTQQLADDMEIIYSAGRTISSSLEWEKAIQSIAQGMALGVKGSNALIYAYDPRAQIAKLLSVYVANTASSTLPPLGSQLDIAKLPELQQAIESSRLLTIDAEAPPSGTKHWVNSLEHSNAAITPLTAQGEAVGLAVLLRTYDQDNFAPSEIFVAESLATQAAAVLRQASLYANILELESVKSDMMRMASHDLKAPISNAAGYLEILAMDLEMGGAKTPDIEDYIDTIKRNLDNMQALVTDLLTLEQVENQRSEAWSQVQLELMLKKIIEEQQPTANLRQHQLTFQVAAPPYVVRGNETILHQAISNLVGNALKYTPNGGLIQVNLYHSTDQTNRVYFQVKDNGFGIPKERQNRIFQRFYRAKTPGTEHISGTGLGLSLVKSIIERHGGDIWFESEEGAGSTFSFWLPLVS